MFIRFCLFLSAFVLATPAQTQNMTEEQLACARVLLERLHVTDWGMAIEPGVKDKELRGWLAVMVERLARTLIGQTPYDAKFSHWEFAPDARWLRAVYRKLVLPAGQELDESAYDAWFRERFSTYDRFEITDLFIWRALHQRVIDIVQDLPGPRHLELFEAPLQGQPAPRGIGVVQLLPNSRALQEEVARGLATFADWELRPVVLFGSPTNGEVVQSPRLLEQATFVTPWNLAGWDRPRAWALPFALHPETSEAHFAGATEQTLDLFLGLHGLHWGDAWYPPFVEDKDPNRVLTEAEELEIAENESRERERMLEWYGRIRGADEPPETYHQPRDFTIVVDLRLNYFTWSRRRLQEIGGLPVDYDLGRLEGNATRMDRALGLPNAIEIFRQLAIELVVPIKLEKSRRLKARAVPKLFEKSEIEVHSQTPEKLDVTFGFLFKPAQRWLRIRFHN